MSSTPTVVGTIHKMLFGLGDAKKPLEATAYIIEEFLLQQIDNIIYKAQDINNSDTEEIGVRNIMFLMRNNPIRLQRMYKYFEFKSHKFEITNGIGSEVDSDKDIVNDLKIYWTEGSNKKGRNQTVHNQMVAFFKEFDLNIAKMKYFDEIKDERLIKNDELSQQYKGDDYLLFQQSRSVSFDGGKVKRDFNEWIQFKLKNNPGTSLLTSAAYEVLQYLAKEIVAQMIDFTHMLRKDTQPQIIKTNEKSSKIPMPDPTMSQIMPDEIVEVMRRAQFKKSFQTSTYCIIF